MVEVIENCNSRLRKLYEELDILDIEYHNRKEDLSNAISAFETKTVRDLTRNYGFWMFHVNRFYEQTKISNLLRVTEHRSYGGNFSGLTILEAVKSSPVTLHALFSRKARGSAACFFDSSSRRFKFKEVVYLGTTGSLVSLFVDDELLNMFLNATTADIEQHAKNFIEKFNDTWVDSIEKSLAEHERKENCKKIAELELQIQTLSQAKEDLLKLQETLTTVQT